MEEAFKRRWFRIGRRSFRWFRITAWLLLLLLLLAGLYLNHVGLPGFLKRALVNKARTQGMELDFTRARLRWYRGLVFENLQLLQSNRPEAPVLRAREADFNATIGWSGNPDIGVSAVELSGASLLWRNLAPHSGPLSISNLTAIISRREGNQIQIDRLSGELERIRFDIDGTITNLAAWRDLFPELHGTKSSVPAAAQIARFVETLHFRQRPELRMTFRGDLRQILQATGQLRIQVPDLASSWVNLTNFSAELKLAGALTNIAALSGRADYLETKFGTVQGVALTSLASPSAGANGEWSYETTVSASDLQTQESTGGMTNTIRIGKLSLSGYAEGSFTNAPGWHGNAKCDLTRVETPWASGKRGIFILDFRPHTGPHPFDPELGFWNRLAAWKLDGEASADDWTVGKVALARVGCSGHWNFPRLEIPTLKGRLYGGEAFVSANLDVITRQAELVNVSDFDVRQLAPVMSDFGRRWIDQFRWDQPPLLRGNAHFITPAWTNPAPDWAACLPTLALHGDVEGAGSFRGFSFNAARSDVHYSNRVWDLRNLLVERSEGKLALDFSSDDQTGVYHFDFKSSIDPQAIKPLVEAEHREFFDQFTTLQPPLVDGELWGKWGSFEQAGLRADLLLSNVVVRGAGMDHVEVSLQYTNGILTARDLHATRAEGRVEGDQIELDFVRQRISFTNVYGTIDPRVVTDAIGKKASRAIAPYRFNPPAAIWLNGTIPMDDVDGADLHFQVAGRKFQVRNLMADQLKGDVHWVGTGLLLTNVEGRVYGGRIAGHALFDFSPPVGTDVRFDAAVSDIDLPSFIGSLRMTNELEGVVGGHLAIVSGNTENRTNWNGFGRVTLHDGFIWEIPIFGIFSPALNAIMPGVGKSKVREGAMNFGITNSWLHTEDLELRASMLRLQYRGKVDIDQKVDAVVEAELLRDTWMVGRVLSLALAPFAKLFEYRVSGSLTDPVSEPLHIPKFLMMTLRPFHSLKRILPEKPVTDPGEARPVPTP